MIKSLEINFNILKSKGEMYIYVGKTPNEEHINLIPDNKTIEICKHIGFELKQVKNELLIFSKK